MTDFAVTDTHALIWVVENRLRKLGRDARRVFERADAGSGIIYVPALSLVEVSEAAWRKRIRLSGGFTRWMQALLSSPNYVIADLTPGIVLRAEGLYAIPERGDRLIAATALELDLPLITRDPEIRRVAGVPTIW